MTLALIFIAASVSLTDSILFLIRHSAAKRRAKMEVWPPMKVLEISDTIPW